MSDNKSEEPPLLSHEECNVLLTFLSVNAMQAHMLSNKTAYHNEINSLSKTCANLITQHHEIPQSIIARIETALEDAHSAELIEIDSQIKHLFYNRKQVPANSFCGEQEIMKLTTQITELEERKTIPVKEVIQRIVYDSLEQAIRVNGVEMPADFNLSQYEYNRVISVSETAPQSNHENDPTIPEKKM
jgi:hypothetical protein